MLFDGIRVQSQQDGIGHFYWDQDKVSTTGDSKEMISSYCKGKGLITLGDSVWINIVVLSRLFGLTPN